MKNNFDIGQDGFEKLLGWLDENRERAGSEYEKIRLKLIKIFHARGCHTAEEMADETFDRVTKNIDTLLESYTGEPVLYFYGVAKKVFLEYIRQPKMEEIPAAYSSPEKSEDLSAIYLECLGECFKSLNSEQRKFFREYYKDEKQKKINRRKILQNKLEMPQSTFHIKAFRLRKTLEKCVLECVGKKNM